MKRKICKVLAFCVIFLGIAQLVNLLFWDNVHSYTRVMLNEMYQYDDNIDIVFLGASHVYRSYDTELSDRLLQKNTFNAGSSSQSFSSSYYLLKEICQYNNLETVYFDVGFIMGIEERISKTSVNILSPYMRNGVNKISMMWDALGIEAIVDFFFPVRYSFNPDFISLYKDKRGYSYKDAFKYVTYDNEEYRGNGFVYSFEVADENTDFFGYTINKRKPLSIVSQQSLERIIGYCKNNGINLILVETPMPDATLTNTEGYTEYLEYIKQIAEENEIEFWNFNLATKNLLTMCLTDYKDNNHLNGSGADKYTTVFCNLIMGLDNGTIHKEEMFFTTYEEKMQKNQDDTITIP